MNESIDLHGARMESSRLLSITWQRDTGVFAGDRMYSRNNTAIGLLLAGVCLGGLALLLVLLALCCRRLSIGRLTVLRVSLIVVGLLQMLSTPVVAMDLLGSFCRLDYCSNLYIVWFASRHFGMCVHLLVVLEFLLERRSPRSLKVPPCLSVPVVLTLELISLLFFNVVKAHVGLGAVATALLLCTCIACCPPRKDLRVLNVFCSGLICFAGTYCPSFVMDCMFLNKVRVPLDRYNIFLCAANMRLVVDLYVCWVTCRPTEEEAPRDIEIGPVDPTFGKQTRFPYGQGFINQGGPSEVRPAAVHISRARLARNAFQ